VRVNTTQHSFANIRTNYIFFSKINMPLTPNQIAAAYQQANQDVTISEAANFLRAHHGMNPNTAKDLITGYRNMRGGTVYKRGLSQPVVTYFLEHTIADYGISSLPNALNSLMASIEYEKDVKRVNRHGLRGIHQLFSRRLTR
jgi:5-methylcytosine-specific restriction protein A